MEPADTTSGDRFGFSVSISGGTIIASAVELCSLYLFRRSGVAWRQDSVVMASDGGTRPYRVHYRDPSFTNLQAVGAMCQGAQVADVIAAVASIDPVMGGVDR